MLDIHEINTGLSTMYRAPNCSTQSFTKGLNVEDHWLDSAKYKDNISCGITGDYKIGFLETRKLEAAQSLFVFLLIE